MAKLARPVIVEANTGAEIQMLLRHPETGGQLIFTVMDGFGETDDPMVLRCLLDHPFRNESKRAGGFILVGSDRELEKLYADAMSVPVRGTELEAAKEQIQVLEKELVEAKKKMVAGAK